MKKINVGFVGLGLMGLPMAKSILKKNIHWLFGVDQKKIIKILEN